MTTPTRIEINCETGEQTVIPLTDEEIATLENNRLRYEIEQTEKEEKAKALAEAKASALAKLEALGLTEEEANALIS
jgi:hypothetical protein